jgi:hypothetical protein
VSRREGDGRSGAPSGPPVARRAEARRLHLWALAALVGATLLVAPVGASSPVGVACLIEKVVLEPAERPETAQIWGACAIAQSNELYRPYGPAGRGYLYYFLPAGRVDVVRTEWSDLKSLAGKGEGAAFGDRTQSLPRLRPASEPPKAPDEYVVSVGVIRLRASPFLDSLKRALDGTLDRP